MVGQGANLANPPGFHPVQPGLRHSGQLPPASLPLPKTHRCQRFRGQAAFGRNDAARQTFYGFRMHLRLNWPGLITGFGLAPANVHDLAMVPEMAADAQGVLLADRNYWSPSLSREIHHSNSANYLHGRTCTSG